MSCFCCVPLCFKYSWTVVDRFRTSTAALRPFRGTFSLLWSERQSCAQTLCLDKLWLSQNLITNHHQRCDHAVLGISVTKSPRRLQMTVFFAVLFRPFTKTTVTDCDRQTWRCRDTILSFTWVNLFLWWLSWGQTPSTQVRLQSGGESNPSWGVGFMSPNCEWRRAWLSFTYRSASNTIHPSSSTDLGLGPNSFSS